MTLCHKYLFEIYGAAYHPRTFMCATLVSAALYEVHTRGEKSFNDSSFWKEQNAILFLVVYIGILKERTLLLHGIFW